MSEKSRKNKIMGEIEGSNRPRTYLLSKFEDRFRFTLAKKIPPFIETYHLTWSSLFSCSIMVVSGYFAKEKVLWLLGISTGLELHYLTDMLDGQVGRLRNTGLVRWGFFADHFLDMFFLASLMISYSLFIPELTFISFCIFITYSLFFFESVLFALVGDEYNTSGFLGLIGPTEITHLIAFVNISFLFIPKSWIKTSFITFFILSFIAVCVQFLKKAEQLWVMDMESKK